MAALQTFILCVIAVFTFLASAEGFFLYSTKKSSQERGGMPPQYFRDTTPAQLPWAPQHPQQYSFDGSGPVTVALPVAVPIQAQWMSTEPWERRRRGYSLRFRGHDPPAHYGSFKGHPLRMAQMPSSLKGMVHNVQLVPCLCPVSKDLPESSFFQQQQQQPQQQQQQQQIPPAYLVQGNPQPNPQT